MSKSLVRISVVVLLLLTFGTVATGQIFGRFRANRAIQNQCPECVEIYSQPVMPSLLPGETVVQPPILQVAQSTVQPVEDLTQQLVADRPSERAACRVRAGNASGSGSVCGRFRDGSLILTNAHVVGTRPGTLVGIDCVIDGKDRSFEGKIVMAAYSNRTQTDWAIVYCEGLPQWRQGILSVLVSERIVSSQPWHAKSTCLTGAS